MKNKICRYLPVGISLKKEIACISTGITIAILYSFSFLTEYYNAYHSLFYGNTKTLIENATMKNFYQLIDGSFTVFVMLIYLLPVLTAFHYAYHFIDSKSIYTMKRLPRKNELHKRCLTIPLASIFVVIFTVSALIGIYYTIYMKVTPHECLTPGQFKGLLRHIIYGGV